MENINQCTQCAGPLGHPRIENNLYTHFCFSCKQCAECKNYISEADLIYCTKYRSSLEEKYGNSNVHTLCLMSELRSAIENKKIEISQRELDLLNTAHLMVHANIDLSIDTNIKDAELKGIAYFNSLPSLDEKYLVLRRVESLAATFSLLMKKEPGTSTLRIQLNAASSKRFSEAISAESKQNAKRIRCSKCSDMFLEPEIVEHFRNCAGAPPKTAAKREKRNRTNFEKAVELSMKYGLTAHEALTSVKAMFEQNGENITFTESETAFSETLRT